MESQTPIQGACLFLGGHLKVARHPPGDRDRPSGFQGDIEAG